MLKTMGAIIIMGSLSFGASIGEEKFDQELAAKIQHKIANDDSLKSDAATVKVIVENGVVTLKGVASSDERRQDIQAKAESQVIQHTPIEQIHSVVVHNELTVSPN